MLLQHNTLPVCKLHTMWKPAFITTTQSSACFAVIYHASKTTYFQCQMVLADSKQPSQRALDSG